jgi:hypothetical protein
MSRGELKLRPALEEALRRRHDVGGVFGPVRWSTPVRLPQRRYSVEVPHWIDLDQGSGETPFDGPVGYWCSWNRDHLQQRGEQVHLYLGTVATDGVVVFVRIYTRDNVPVAWAMGEHPQYNDHRYELEVTS